MKKIYYTAITEFEVIRPTNELEKAGEKLKLSAFGEFCPDNSMRAYDLLYLLLLPQYYRISKIVDKGIGYKMKDQNNLINQSTNKSSKMTENLNFGQAIEALKQGKSVARKGWNGKNMYLTLQGGSVIKSSFARGGAALARKNEPDLPTEIIIGSHIDMRAADGSIVVGWLASQTDMLSEDWCILD